MEMPEPGNAANIHFDEATAGQAAIRLYSARAGRSTPKR